MTVTRRRFMAIAACFAGTPALAQRHAWIGRAFGAEVSIALNGPRGRAAPALDAARDLIARVERLFSLYDPRSDLVQLNASGTRVVPARFVALMQIADRAHRLTGGLFDPTVQPMWRAISDGGDVQAAAQLVGWDQVHLQDRTVRLAPGQALTFNGIAQGYATDLVSDLLRAHGFDHTLVNIGEYRGQGGPWRLGLSDPQHGLLATRTVSDSAIATSSPLATPLGAHGHIVHAAASPRWSTVSVEADSAALADALSTGLTLADQTLIKAVRTAPGVHRITLVDKTGDLTTL
ncbi:MAG: FAD:protein FMN transferase [Pseudomonadota bacterium]